MVSQVVGEVVLPMLQLTLGEIGCTCLCKVVVIFVEVLVYALVLLACLVGVDAERKAFWAGGVGV